MARTSSIVLSGQLDAAKKRVVPLAWQALPIHPVIATYPESARNIEFMAPHKGVMVVGYGDWNANTGPTQLVGYNLETAAPVTLMDTPSPTEAFTRARVFDGAMYLPWIDPLGASHRGGFTTDEGGTWHDVVATPVDGMVHTFDVAKFKGSLFICGSITTTGPGIGAGVVWRRSPAGVWTKVLTSTRNSPAARFYIFNDPDWPIDTTGRLVVKDSDGSPTGTSNYWITEDGINWSPQVAPYASLDQYKWYDRGQFKLTVPSALHPQYPVISEAPVGGVVGDWVWAYNGNTQQVMRAPRV